MKRFCLMLALILILQTFCSCAQVPEATGPSRPADIPADPALWSEEDWYRELFDLRNKVEISIDMSDGELAKLQADYEHYSSWGSKSPIYRMADVTVTITTPEGTAGTCTLEQVGVRMKGNTSRTSFYSEEEGIYNHIHLKLDFQETFDDEEYYGDEALAWEEADRDARKDRTFATLEKIDLRWNKCADSTYLKELYSYEIYRTNGVLAPHMNLSALTWAGIPMGVYTVNEPVDKIFLKKHLPEEACGGDLYKCGWGNHGGAGFTSLKSIGIEDEDKGEFYAYDLKTNKKTSDHAALKNLIMQLNSGQLTKETFEALLDLDNFLNFCAVSWVVGNPDDLRNNYNNFYIYFRADNGKAMLIPYDCDRCLGITAQWNPTGTGCTDDDPFSAERLSVDRNDSETDRSQRNPMILYTVTKGGYFVEEYAALLASLAESKWVRTETFASYFQTARDLYGGVVLPGKELCNSIGEYYHFDMERTSDFSSNGNISFEEYMTAKLETLEHYLSDPAYRQGELALPSPAYYIRADFTDWELDTNYAMLAANGHYVLSVTGGEEMRLKVYCALDDRWYGTECLAPECEDVCRSDGHTNLVLDPGTYEIRFDPLNGIVYAEKTGG